MPVKYLKDVPIDKKKVLIRVDYNVPYDKGMNITDDTRITATLPTIDYCIERKATIILVSHLGRPKGKIVPEMSLKPVAKRLSELIKKDVLFIDTPYGDQLKNEVAAVPAGSIVLLENIRFHPGEDKNDPELGKLLAEMCDVYVNDAFATAHRAASSNEAVTKFAKTSLAGFLLENEIEYFRKAMEKPEKPVGAIIGGAKVSSKLDALNNIISKVDFLIIGGGMAFTFLKANGIEVGKSILEEDLVGTASNIMSQAKSKGVEVLLPVDVIVAQAFENDSPKQVVPVNSIPADSIGLDIGPETIKLFNDKIKSSKTIIWNGPMGAFEMPNFAEGTNQVAETLASSDCLSIVGGGDSVTAVNQAGVADKISYISTGGGAFLELLEGKTLPAIAALDK
ncbi:MAG TPA: phosphoglycerate kinase [Spirochaetota bacterium]|nr:phosphoglycerate kinase [Spirochaetota bacterium]HPI88292.1 phosphoglycerate kinase [Spirochaetota bacterium]HPR47756.1 phosphoglycerate kinase [Spirochaetota bacterium]